MRKLTDEEIHMIGGGNPAALIAGGALVAAGGAYLSGGSPGQITGAAIVGAVSGGYGAVAAAATGAGKVIYTGYSLATGMATSLFTRSTSSA